MYDQDISNLQILPELQMIKYENVVKELVPNIDQIHQNRKDLILEHHDYNNSILYSKEIDQANLSVYSVAKHSNLSNKSSKSNNILDINQLSSLKLRQLSYNVNYEHQASKSINNHDQ